MTVRTLDNNAFLKAVEQLHSTINFTPDLVVEILNAGAYVGEALRNQQKITGIPSVKIKAQRQHESLKQSRFVRKILKLLPYKLLNILRQIEAIQAEKRHQKQRPTLTNQSIKIPAALDKQTIKQILIVDDAIDTGKTVAQVRRVIQKQFPDASIKIAVITWTFANSIIKPDFYIFKSTLVRFPWSKDYKGNDFEQKSFDSRS